MLLQPRVGTNLIEATRAFRRRWRDQAWARLLYYRLYFPLIYSLPSIGGIRHRGLAVSRRPLVLFLPESPPPESSLYKICKTNRYRFTTRPTAKADIVVRWENVTVGAPTGRRLEWADDVRLVNFGSLDISKRRLDEAHRAVFGYGLSVDPLTHVGPGVVKSDLNGLHDGRVVTFPVEQVEDGVVYQRLIKNEIEGGMVGDVRVPIFGNTIPIVYRRFRPESARFGRGGDTSTVIASAEEYLTPQEQKLILALAREIGLDYGEFDVLRDADDGRIYVVDANNTPMSPPSYVYKSDRWRVETTLADAFESAFARRRT